jgi:hypothetical protein
LIIAGSAGVAISEYSEGRINPSGLLSLKESKSRSRSSVDLSPKLCSVVIVPF